MNTEQPIDPYRAPDALGTEPAPAERSAGTPLDWEPFESFQFAWEAVRRHWMVVLYQFVAGIVGALIATVGSVAQNLMALSGDGDLVLLSWVVYGVATLLNVPLAAWMALGMSRYALEMARGRKPEFALVFRTEGLGTAVAIQLVTVLFFILAACVLLGPGAWFVFQKDQPGIGATLLVGGMMLLSVLAIFVTAKWILFSTLAVADGARGTEALERSAAVSRGVFWRIVLFALLLMLLSVVAMIAGLLMLCIGLIATIPAAQAMSQIALAHGYLLRRGERPVLPAPN